MIHRGKDFRKDFHRLQILRAYTNAPLMALTATATYATQEEIIRLLSLENPVIIKRKLNRDSIFYSLMKKSSLNVN